VRLVLVLCGQGPNELLAAAPLDHQARRSLVPAGYAPQVGALALLGQDPLQAWAGPATWAALGAGSVVSEDETAYLLTPVRLEGERVAEVLRPGAGALDDLREALGEDPDLAGEAAAIAVAEGELVLVVGTPFQGPPSLRRERLVGRSADCLPAGSARLLARVVVAGRRVGGRLLTGAAGSGALIPHSPGGPAELTPLREVWLGVGRGVVVGARAQSVRALAEGLGLARIAVRPGEELHTVAEAEGRYDVGLALVEEPGDLDLLAGASAVVVASAPDEAGWVGLAWRGEGVLGEGVDPLRGLLGLPG
jgi:hypothetical protein